MARKLLQAATVLASGFVFTGQATAQPVTGIYIGAGGGANFEQRGRNTASIFSNGSVYRSAYSQQNVGVTGVGSLGYGLGNGLRFELEGDYRYNRIGRPLGMFTGASSGGREQKYGPMVNVLFDLDVGSPYAFPYIGGGAGYQWEDRRRTTTGPTAILLPNNNLAIFSNPATTTVSSGVDSSFAYQAIAGVSFPIPPVVGLSLTAEYRFFALAESRTYRVQVGGPGGLGLRARFEDDYNHSLMLGLRYAFNVAPPPVANAAPPVAPVSASRTYLVFFDWDRADLTDRARQIIAEAAQATTRMQVTRIEVSGHTDTTGTAQYNQGLSVRRAQNVASELVRLGVPQGSITTQGYGFSRPLVSTGPGVREPENRRVEIVMR